jgi:hypothetical protein
VDRLKFEERAMGFGVVIALVLSAPSPATSAPAPSNTAFLKTATGSEVVPVLCRGGVSARTHSCHVHIVTPSYGNEGRGCFVVTDRTRGLRRWTPSC